MYQDNPIRASVGENFFRRNRTCPSDTAFLADFPGFLRCGSPRLRVELLGVEVLRVEVLSVESPRLCSLGGSPRLLVGGERSENGGERSEKENGNFNFLWVEAPDFSPG